jgi:hypothetical protein
MQKNPSIFKHPSRSVKFCQIFFEITNICLFHSRFIFLKIQANTELFFWTKIGQTWTRFKWTWSSIRKAKHTLVTIAWNSTTFTTWKPKVCNTHIPVKRYTIHPSSVDRFSEKISLKCTDFKNVIFEKIPWAHSVVPEVTEVKQPRNPKWQKF